MSKLPSREMTLLAGALGEAEDALAEMPLTDEVRSFQKRLAAIKTVSVGVVRNVPMLTDPQRSKLVSDAMSLAAEILEARRQLPR